MVGILGILVSFWETQFPVAMLVSGKVPLSWIFFRVCYTCRWRSATTLPPIIMEVQNGIYFSYTATFHWTMILGSKSTLPETNSSFLKISKNSQKGRKQLDHLPTCHPFLGGRLLLAFLSPFQGRALSSPHHFSSTGHLSELLQIQSSPWAPSGVSPRRSLRPPGNQWKVAGRWLEVTSSNNCWKTYSSWTNLLVVGM